MVESTGQHYQKSIKSRLSGWKRQLALDLVRTLPSCFHIPSRNQIVFTQGQISVYEYEELQDYGFLAREQLYESIERAIRSQFRIIS